MAEGSNNSSSPVLERSSSLNSRFGKLRLEEQRKILASHIDTEERVTWQYRPWVIKQEPAKTLKKHQSGEGRKVPGRYYLDDPTAINQNPYKPKKYLTAGEALDLLDKAGLIPEDEIG